MNTAFGRKFSPYDIHDAVGEKDFCTRQAVVEWPEFMMHDAVSLANWPTLLALFPEFQLTVQLGTEVIASLNSIPLAAPPVSQLDDGGWDWALETGISGKRVERPANCLCGLQIGICREMQGKGLAGMMIALMKALAQKHGFSRLIIPVRPADKALFPLISMEEYCRRKRSDGLPADPWLRAHVKCGAQMLFPCLSSMSISGSISEWKTWTGMDFPQSGKYCIPGALVPVEFFLENDKAEYIEPNYWIAYSLAEA